MSFGCSFEVMLRSDVAESTPARPGFWDLGCSFEVMLRSDVAESTPARPGFWDLLRVSLCFKDRKICLGAIESTDLDRR